MTHDPETATASLTLPEGVELDEKKREALAWLIADALGGLAGVAIIGDRKSLYVETLEPALIDADGALWCPVCQTDVAPANLEAVDAAHRWTAADTIGMGSQVVAFFSDQGPDWGDTSHYLHYQDGIVGPHRVALPLDWREDWIG